MKFKEYVNKRDSGIEFNEVGFSTSCVANYSLPIGGAVTRTWPLTIADSEFKTPEETKKHKKKKHK